MRSAAVAHRWMVISFGHRGTRGMNLQVCRNRTESIQNTVLFGPSLRGVECRQNNGACKLVFQRQPFSHVLLIVIDRSRLVVSFFAFDS